MIRITGGGLRGRRLKTLRGTDSRPTLSRVREAVFNILGGSHRGAGFLDLFCGVGTMGIEALSRGAEKAIFVERNARCARILDENLKALGLGNRARVVVTDAIRWLESGEVESEIIFVDPPYASGHAKRVLELLGSGGDRTMQWVVVQHGRKGVLPAEVGVLRRVRSRRYGDTVVDFYQSVADVS